MDTKKADEPIIRTYQEDKEISERVPNVNDERPLPEENTEPLLEKTNVNDERPLPEENNEPLLEKPTANEKPVVPKSVSNRKNQRRRDCYICSRHLHQRDKSLQMEQDQQRSRSLHFVAEEENANKQTLTENDKEQRDKSLQMEQDQQRSRSLHFVAEEENANKQTLTENDKEVEGKPRGAAKVGSSILDKWIIANEQDSPTGLHDTDACFPDTLVEYMGDILDNYLKLECNIPKCIHPSYLITVQLGVISPEMRQDVVDWLIMIHQFYDLMQETLYLSVNAMDIYLNHEPIQSCNLKLVALCALFMAGKYEEISFPEIQEVVLITGEEYTARQIIYMEETMAGCLQHTFGWPTQFKFLNLFLKVAGAETLIRHMAYFLSQLSLTQYEMLKYPPSKLAAAAIYCAQCAIHDNPQWNKDLQLYAGYSEENLKECARLMAKCHKNSRSTLTGLYNKFSSRRFSCVAFKQPATIPE